MATTIRTEARSMCDSWNGPLLASATARTLVGPFAQLAISNEAPSIVVTHSVKHLDTRSADATIRVSDTAVYRKRCCLMRSHTAKSSAILLRDIIVAADQFSRT
jgi:hypothetical protein